jgi:hypothetical protein
MRLLARVKQLAGLDEHLRARLLFACLIGMLWLCAFVLPGRLVDRALRPGQQPLTAAERVKAENDVRTTLVQVVGGILLSFGAISTWRQLQISRQQLQHNLEGQITERFTRAIDQLDYKKSLEVRLGGIYALERIARDSERDHWPIMEVLTAYVRQHAAWKEEPQEENQEGQFKPPAPDIQAILTVLGRRARTFERGKDQRLDLRATDLRGAALAGAHLEGAFLWGANLEKADLPQADLKGASLFCAHLERTALLQADLKGADLEGAFLWGANLAGAHMEGAFLRGAHLEGAHLKAAVLTGAIGLTMQQVESAITDENTKLPDYIAWQARPT